MELDEREDVEAEQESSESLRGLRVAAAFFALRAVLDFGFLALLTPEDARALGLSLVVDLGFAMAFLAGWERARPYAIIRVGLGWLYLSFYAVGNPVAAYLVPFAAESFGAVAFLLLLWGTPSRRRVVAGAALFAIHALGYLLTPIVVGALTSSSLGEVHALEGRHLPYTLTLPPGWRSLPSEGDTHAGATSAESGARVSVEASPGRSRRTTTLDALDAEAESNARAFADDLVVVERRPHPHGRVLEVVARSRDQEEHSFVGVFFGRGVSYRVTAAVDATHFESVGLELREIVTSFDPGD